MKPAEFSLPKDILAQASVSGSVYAWPIDCIPGVILAARNANLVNIGGQLQFRLNDIGTCECYWIEIDTSKSVSTSLPWPERVAQTAETALAEYSQLPSKFDFLAEGHDAFPKPFADFEKQWGDPADGMCFVWYLEAFDET